MFRSLEFRVKKLRRFRELRRLEGLIFFSNRFLPIRTEKHIGQNRVESVRKPFIIFIINKICVNLFYLRHLCSDNCFRTHAVRPYAAQKRTTFRIVHKKKGPVSEPLFLTI